MGRIITQEKRDMISAARAENPDAVGPALGAILIAGNVPIEAAASLLAVSEPTIYRWMYGQASPRDADKILKVKRLMTVLRKAKREKELPMAGPIKARIAMTIALVKKYRTAPKHTD